MPRKNKKQPPSLVESIAHEMAHNKNIRGQDDMESIYRRLAGHLLTQRILSKMQSVKEQNKGTTRLIINAPDRPLEEALQKAEEKFEKVLHANRESSSADKSPQIDHIPLDDLDDVDLETIEKLEEKGVRIIYPNLKYAKAKYENVNEVMKYIESEGGADGIKIVIMNFND